MGIYDGGTPNSTISVPAQSRLRLRSIIISTGYCGDFPGRPCVTCSTSPAEPAATPSSLGGKGYDIVSSDISDSTDPDRNRATGNRVFSLEEMSALDDCGFDVLKYRSGYLPDETLTADTWHVVPIARWRG